MTNTKSLSGGGAWPLGGSEHDEGHELAIAEDLPVGAVDLKLRQRSVLSLLMQGASIGEAARSCSVGRATVYRWMKTDEPFKAALRGWQEQSLASARSRLVAASEQAVNILLGQLEKGDLRAAMAVLKSGGLLAASAGLIQEPKADPSTREASRAMRITPALEMRLREMLMSLSGTESPEEQTNKLLTVTEPAAVEVNKASAAVVGG